MADSRASSSMLDSVMYEEQNEKNISKIPNILPHERVFPIQIGSELFKLSGASLSSDAPSYFSQYFVCQIRRAEERGDDIGNAIRTLYIDRDPVTFKDIALHLQGYHVTPKDGTHFVRLFADAQFYSLPKLISQLYDEPRFISIGNREFQIPRDIFADPGNSPNYFSLALAVFSPDDVFPGLDRDGLLRPPSILPPSNAKCSANTFSELLHLLKGYKVEVRNETHRAQLLQDCKYFNLKGLEQRLILHRRGYNQSRGREEIEMRLEDILKSGISVVFEGAANNEMGTHSPSPEVSLGWVNYGRPYVGETAAELVLEIGGEKTRLHFSPTGSVRAEFFSDVRTRVTKLLEVVATKLNLSPTKAPLGLLMSAGGAGSQPATPGNTPLSDEDRVKVAFEPETAIFLDGKPFSWDSEEVRQLAGENVAPISEGGSNGRESPASSAGGFGFVPRLKRRRVDSYGGMVAGMGSVGVSAGNGGGGTTASFGGEPWIVKTGQWRLKIQGPRSASPGMGAASRKSNADCVLVAVKIDAYSSEEGRNAARGFLKG